MNDNLEEIIVAFFEGELSEDQKNGLIEARKKSKEAERLFQKYTLVYNDVENQETKYPRKSMESSFEKLLNREKQLLNENPKEVPVLIRSRKRLFLYTSVAAVFLLLIIATGIFFSNKSTISQMNNELVSLRYEMNKLLNNSSTSVRIQAVNLSYDIDLPDDDIIRALIETMNTDPSENVKLAAVNALGKFAKYEPVKQELIKAVKNQESPYVQVKIIAILANTKAKDVIPVLDEIIENKETEFFVKSEAKFEKSKIIKI